MSLNYDVKTLFYKYSNGVSNTIMQLFHIKVNIVIK